MFFISPDAGFSIFSVKGYGDNLPDRTIDGVDNVIGVDNGVDWLQALKKTHHDIDKSIYIFFMEKRKKTIKKL